MDDVFFTELEKGGTVVSNTEVNKFDFFKHIVNGYGYVV